jgi:hypothetical protein
MTRTRLTALALAATTLLAPGCGGSSKPLTRAQLIARADPICRTVVEKVNYGALTPIRIVRFAARLAAIERRAYEQLAQLTPPASLADDWQLIVDGFKESANDFHMLEHAAHPDSEGGRLESLYGAVRGKAWTARGDGFKDCGEY